MAVYTPQLHASMTLTPASVRAAVLEQTERTRQSSKADIERFITESELRIISLDSQINALTELRDLQRACVLALRYIISPIRTLPVELVAEIFDLAIEDKTHIHDAHRISQVCADWRQVAHKTPRLWIRPLRVNLCKKENVSDGLKTWLARSAPMPIMIRMSFLPGLRDISAGILEEVLRVAPRLGSLQISTILAAPSSLVRQLGQCRLASLEELDLGRIDDEIDSTPLSFTTVPRLRKLRIINCPIAYQILVPWAQLTDLTVSASPDVTYGILSQCANLLKAVVITSRWAPLPVVNQTILFFSQLHTLSLDFLASSEHIASFFDYLSTPLLQDLCLNSNPVHWPQAHFTAFQLRTPNITRLEFGYSASMTSDDLVAAVRHASSLTHLILTSCDNVFDDTFICTLHYQDGVTPLVPRLHNLVVSSEMADFTEDVLAGMIASRWWTDTELDSEVTPPAVARWTHVEFDIEGYEWGPQFGDILKDIPSDILSY
ncbi:F-box domain-containing protein [Mycena sanguinolenta]|uniref:F-box domain-containing protein n=1 Tax=Mycena sanguinolenta TaxID=230812 RepID=A0A8H6YF88_9AGAR|nr:F-box domain-containing protein [Mycena sanguinolenta]